MSEQISIASIAISGDAEVSATVKKSAVLTLIAAMRPHQWSKNLFIFAPILFAKKITEPIAVLYTFLAFGVFCLLASGLYIFNDWLDIEEDRQHPEKRFRPLASGSLPVVPALTAAGLFAVGSLTVAWFVGITFFGVAGLYFVLTLAYCLALKRMIILDCMTIATGFVLRVVGGAVAINVVATHWLIVCAFLLALFLAFSKRRQELLKLSTEAGRQRAVLTQYSVSYLGQVNIALIAATIVCYALYTVAPETVSKFGTEKLIYGTVFVVYGLLRYMALIEDPENGGNPTRMLLRDMPLQITVVAWGLFNAIVIYCSPH